jgi:mannose-6-phosphate isomerase-like protein (cupin superfamily)
MENDMNWLENYLTSAFQSGQSPSGKAETPDKSLPSKVYVCDDLPVHHMKTVDSRALVGGRTVDGCSFSAHESALQPNSEPHPPHHHLGEEMFLVLDGTLRVTINGVSSLVTKGSVAFIGSGDEHGIFNPGKVPAKYYVVEFGPQGKTPHAIDDGAQHAPQS